MSNPVYRYHVLYAGQLMPGHDRESVMRSLAAALHLSDEKVNALFSGNQRVMKRTESLDQAQAFVRVFANAGAVATIETRDGIPVNSGAEAGSATNHSPAHKVAASGELPAFRPFPGNWLFKPALFIATLLETSITFLYVVLLIGATLLLFYHTLLADWLFEAVPSPWLAAPLTALLLMAGGVILALLAKPLLGLVRRKEPFFILNRELEPEFFSYVEEICALAGTTPPVEIRVNHSSLLSIRPLWSWQGISKRQKVLIIGLPLLAGLDSRQLAALLAQACAAWRPGFTRVMGQLLDGNIRWLHRAGFDRDPVDRKLREWQLRFPRLARGLEHLVRVAGWSAVPARLRLRFSRFLSRRLLHRLFADSDILARQVAGNGAVSSAMQQCRLIDFAAQNTLPALEKMWQERGTLPDNLAQAVVARASLYPVQTQLQLEQLEGRRSIETGGFKPTTAQRIALLDSSSEKGAYDIAAPCAAYFRRLEKLMHILSVRYSHSHLHIPVTTNKLVRTPAKGSQEYEANSQIGRYFGALYGDFIPLRLRTQVAAQGSDANVLAQAWREGVARILAEQQKAKLAAATLASIDEEVIELSNRELLQRSGVGSVLTGLMPFKGREAEELLQACRDIENSYDKAVGDLEQLYKPYAERLAAALALLGTAATRQGMKDAEQNYLEVQQLLVVYERVEHNYAKLRELRLQTILIESLLSYQSIKPTAKLKDRIRELSDDISRTVAAFAVFYKQTPYPFETEERYDNLFDWVLAQAADGEGAAADFDRGSDTVKQLALMQRLILGRLTTIALQVESAMKLKPSAASGQG